MADPSQQPTPGYQDPRVVLLNWLLPDLRVVLVIGLLAIVWKVLDMLQATPALLQNSSFMLFIGVFVGGSGIGGIVAHYFGGTQAGTKVMAEQSNALIKGQKTDGAAQ